MTDAESSQQIEHEVGEDGETDVYVCTTCGMHFKVSQAHYHEPTACPWG